MYRNYIDVNLNANGDGNLGLTEEDVKIISVHLVDSYGDITLVRISSDTNWRVHSSTLKSQTVRVRYTYVEKWIIK